MNDATKQDPSIRPGQVVYCREEDLPSIHLGQVPINDPVDHPKHYTSHPSGVECITVTEHMGFNLGNAMKYLWRADLKANAIEDLKKARWYIERELKKRSVKEKC